MSRVSIPELVVALQSGAPLRDALASALQDEELTVLYWLDQRQGTARGGWVDPLGHAVPEPEPRAGRAVKVVEQDGRRIASITYDAALDDEPELLDAVTAAAGLTLRSDRLQVELRAEVEFLDTVTNTVPSLLAIVGTDGRIQNVNAAALEVAGHERKDEVIGRLYWDVFIDPGESARPSRSASQRSLPTSRPASTRTRSRTREASTTSSTGGRLRTTTRPASSPRSSPADSTSPCAGSASESSNASETSRRRSSRRCRASWSRSHATARSATATSTTRRSAPTAPSRRRSGGRTTSSSGDSSSTSSSRTTTDAQRTRSQPPPAGTASEPVESELRSADGTSRAFAWSAIPVADVTDRLEGLVLVTGMDITERLRLEDEKERERAFLNAIANTAPSLLCLIDDNGVMTEGGANIAFEETLEYDPAEIGGQVFWEAFVDPEESDEVRDAIMRVAAGEPPAERDNTWLTKTGRRLSVAWTCTPLPSMDERTLFLMTGIDITERKRGAEELRASRARLVRAEETARRALERNLHDGAQQRLVALSVSLRLLESRLESDRDAALELLAGAQTELAQALEELRELARGIHPAVLTDRGLRPALETLAARTPVPVELIAPDERLVADVEAAAYYVVAESLTNVAKYARATSARVCVQPQDGVLVVTVSDDGVGGADPVNGSGLRGLVDRVAVLDGTLAIESPSGGGTSIRAEIPLVETRHTLAP